MKVLALAVVALCVGLSFAEEDSMDAYWYKSSWQSGKKPHIAMYTQGTSRWEAGCRSGRVTCSIVVSYRKVESPEAQDLEDAPAFETKSVNFGEWERERGLVDVDDLDANSLYQVRVQPKINDRLGPARDFFIRTVASEDGTAITKYKRGYEKREFSDAAIKSKLMKLLEGMLQ